jgi:predicted acetyltransferase
MLHRLHDDARARGDVAAILTASDGSIYPRFGYGVAASVAQWSLDAHRATLRHAADTAGDLDLLLGVDAAATLAEAWVRLRGTRAGWLARSEDWWRIIVGPKEQWKGGGDVHTLLLRDTTGTVTGAAVHRIHFDVDRGVQNWRVEVLDLFGADAAIEARLWQELCRLDHVSTVGVRVGPVDEPLRWLLTDPRQMKVATIVDLLWLCPLDIPALLSARTYGASPGPIVVAVTDDFDPVNAGTYRIDGGPDGAECTRIVGVEPDLALESSDIGMLALGGTTPSVLAAAGRLVECTPGAVARADVLFPTGRAPFCSTFF